MLFLNNPGQFSFFQEIFISIAQLYICVVLVNSQKYLFNPYPSGTKTSFGTSKEPGQPAHLYCWLTKFNSHLNILIKIMDCGKKDCSINIAVAGQGVKYSHFLFFYFNVFGN